MRRLIDAVFYLSKQELAFRGMMSEKVPKIKGIMSSYYMFLKTMIMF